MRRGNGDGSIIKLSGKRRRPYAVRVTVGWSDNGKQIYKYIGYYTGKREANQAAPERCTNQIKGRTDPNRDNSKTISGRGRAKLANAATLRTRGKTL